MDTYTTFNDFFFNTIPAFFYFMALWNITVIGSALLYRRFNRHATN